MCSILLVVVVILDEYGFEWNHDIILKIGFVAGGTVLYFAMNASINALNFSYRKNKNRLTAFYIPIMIWIVLLLGGIPSIIQNRGYSISDWIAIILFLEPILYNLTLIKAITRSS